MSRPGEPTRDTFESSRRGLSHHSVRQANAKTVLTIVAFNAGVSNAGISRLSGLAPQTVSAILVGLEEDGLINRGPVLRGRRGQPATPILLNPDGGLAIGVEIGLRHLDVIVLDMHATVLGHHHIDFAYPDARTMVDAIAGIVATFTAALTPNQRERLLDLGVAMPGAMAELLELLPAPPGQAALWREMDLAAELAERTGLAISIFNDGNAGCWAELIALEPPRPANIIYLLVSHFIAAGIVGDGALWEGPTGNAAELGSILISHVDGPPQTAHRIASLSAFRERLESAGHNVQAQPAETLCGGNWGQETAQWRDHTAKALAQVIFNATTVLEQPLVIIDTLLSPAMGAALVGQVESELACLPARPTPAPRVMQGQLGGLAPAIGAAELPMFRRYF